MQLRARDFRRRARQALSPGLARAIGILVLTVVMVAIITRLWSEVSTLLLGGLGQYLNLAQITQAAIANDEQLMLKQMQELLIRLPQVLPLLVAAQSLYFVGTLAIKFLFVPFLGIGTLRWFSRNRELSVTPPISLYFSLFKRGKRIELIAACFWKQLWLTIWALPGYVLMFFALDGYVNGLLTLYQHSGHLGFVNEGWSVLLWQYLLSSTLLSLGAFVWAVAVTIPKTYSYALQDWLLADNPALGARYSLNLAKRMMKGRKWRLFCLDLSYIGWYLLALPLFFVFFFFVFAHSQAARAEFYAECRDAAVREGWLRMEDLGYRQI